MASLIRRSSKKRHGTENNRSWLSTCSQVIRPWHLKVQHGKPCHTFKKLDEVFSYHPLGMDLESSNTKPSRNQAERFLVLRYHFSKKSA